jgi:predicted lipid-binding transport protein (Tim44 family)
VEPFPIPVRPGGGLPSGSHLPLHFGGTSDFWKFIAAAGGILAAAWLGGAVGQALAEKRAPGSTKQASGLGVPGPDFIHPDWGVAPKAERTFRLMEFLAHRNPLFEPSALRRWVERRFLDVQDCWQRGDYGPLGGLLMPDIRAEHERQLAAMRANGERNVLRDLAVERLEFVHLDCPANPDRQEITALITFRAASHYVDARTGAFRRGSQVPTSFQELWVFRRKDDAWHLAWIERSHGSTRLVRPNHVEELTDEQQKHAEECIDL